MSQKKNVLRNSMFYTMGNLLLKAFSFFLIPLYTSYLSPEQYGILNLSNGFTSVLTMMLMLGLQYSVVRFFADYKDDPNKVRRMFGSVITFIILASVVTFVALFLLKEFWTGIFFEGIDFYPIVILSILIAIVQGLYTVYQDILKGMQLAKQSIVLTYLFFFLLLASNIYTVVYLELGAVGILYSTLAVYLIMTVLMFVDLTKKQLFVFTIDRIMLKELLKYSLPLVPHTMAYTFSNYATRLIISNKMSLSMLGVYSLSSQFGNLSDIILNSIQSAFQPWFFNRLNDTDDSKVDDVANTSYMLMWIYGLFFILVGVFSQEAILLMADESYKEAWIYVPFIVLSIAIKSPLYFYNNFLYYDKTKTKFLFYITVVTSIICIVLTFVLVPVMGIYGAILASVVSLIFRLALILKIVYNESKHYYSIFRLHVLFIVPMIFMGVALIPSYSLYHSSLSMVNFLYKSLIICVYIIIVSYLYKSQIHKCVKQYIHK